MIKAQNFKRRWQDIKDDVLAGMEQIHINEKVVNAYFTNQVEEKLKQTIEHAIEMITFYYCIYIMLYLLVRYT